MVSLLVCASKLGCSYTQRHESCLLAILEERSCRVLQDVGVLKTELQAHSRMLSAMAVHPTRPLFATAAEDATMAVWQLPNDDQAVC